MSDAERIAQLIAALRDDNEALRDHAMASLGQMGVEAVPQLIGLMADEKWDATWNAGSSLKSDSRWPIAMLMVANLFYGATLLLTVIARAFDLMLTGGADG